MALGGVSNKILTSLTCLPPQLDSFTSANNSDLFFQQQPTLQFPQCGGNTQTRQHSSMTSSSSSAASKTAATMSMMMMQNDDSSSNSQSGSRGSTATPPNLDGVGGFGGEESDYNSEHFAALVGGDAADAGQVGELADTFDLETIDNLIDDDLFQCGGADASDFFVTPTVGDGEDELINHNSGNANDVISMPPTLSQHQQQQQQLFFGAPQIISVQPPCNPYTLTQPPPQQQPQQLTIKQQNGGDFSVNFAGFRGVAANGWSSIAQHQQQQQQQSHFVGASAIAAAAAALPLHNRVLNRQQRSKQRRKSLLPTCITELTPPPSDVDDNDDDDDDYNDDDNDNDNNINNNNNNYGDDGNDAIRVGNGLRNNYDMNGDVIEQQHYQQQQQRRNAKRGGSVQRPQQPSLAALNNEDLIGQPGQRIRLSVDEISLLRKEGCAHPPTRLPLTREEEKMLRLVRRKIRNKKSAKISRAKRQDYVEGLEKRVEKANLENSTLSKQLQRARTDKAQLTNEVRHLRRLLGKFLPSFAASNDDNNTKNSGGGDSLLPLHHRQPIKSGGGAALNQQPISGGSDLIGGANSGNNNSNSHYQHQMFLGTSLMMLFMTFAFIFAPEFNPTTLQQQQQQQQPIQQQQKGGPQNQLALLTNQRSPLIQPASAVSAIVGSIGVQQSATANAVSSRTLLSTANQNAAVSLIKQYGQFGHNNNNNSNKNNLMSTNSNPILKFSSRREAGKCLAKLEPVGRGGVGGGNAIIQKNLVTPIVKTTTTATKTVNVKHEKTEPPPPIRINAAASLLKRTTNNSMSSTHAGGGGEVESAAKVIKIIKMDPVKLSQLPLDKRKFIQTIPIQQHHQPITARIT